MAPGLFTRVPSSPVEVAGGENAVAPQRFGREHDGVGGRHHIRQGVAGVAVQQADGNREGRDSGMVQCRCQLGPYALGYNAGLGLRAFRKDGDELFAAVAGHEIVRLS